MTKILIFYGFFCIFSPNKKLNWILCTVLLVFRVFWVSGLCGPGLSSSYVFFLNVFCVLILKKNLDRPKYFFFCILSFFLVKILFLTPNSQFQWYLRFLKLLGYVAQVCSSSYGFFCVFAVFIKKRFEVDPNSWFFRCFWFFG